MDALGIAVRVGATYLFLLVILRIAGKRTILEGTPFDFVVALILGDFPDDIIWGEVPLAQGLVAIGTIMTVHLVVVYASYHSERFDQLVGSGPTPVLRDGRRLADGLARARMNGGDVDVQLRLRGRPRDADVAEAFIESTGELSLRPTDAARAAQRRDLRRRGAA
jgi:uncharacterized membrane protein YcaP (DUF421 family)